MGKKTSKKIKKKSGQKPKAEKKEAQKISKREAEVTQLLSSLENLEKEYKQGKISKEAYEKLKVEYADNLKELEHVSFFENIKQKISIYNVLLIAIVALAFYIRAVLPYDNVFIGDTVRFGGNDPWYHMRLVENTIRNFPHRIFFDPYTHFPFGDVLHFGPLYDQIIAFIALLVGLGHPSLRTIEIMGAYFPAVLGALVALPVYFIGKIVFDKRVGLLSALIVVIMPGQFLSRSLLGFTDHHVAETLFSTLTIMFFMMAIRRAEGTRFEHVLGEEKGILRGPLAYSILAGLMFGCYLLCWAGALLIGFIIAVSVIIQHITDHLRNKSTDHLCIVGVITFLIPLMMVIPTIMQGAGQYSSLHIFSFIIGILAFLLLSGTSKLMDHKEIARSYYPLILIGIGAIGAAGIHLINPSLLSSIFGSFSIFQPSGGLLTVAEATSIFYRGGQFSLQWVWENFTMCFYTALIALVMVVYRMLKEWIPEDTLLVVWSTVMFFAIVGQNRFAYYFAVNVAILSGYFGIKMLEWGGLGELHKDFKRRVKDSSDIGYFVSRYVKLVHVFVVILVVLLFIYPNVNITMGSGPGAARWTGGPSMDWHSALDWMRYNTPDPGLDYYALYEAPAPGETYRYPDSAYGVMSWWDYGHWITRIAHRIPNANPFQSGIGGPIGSDNPGACVFFISKTEAEANEVADELGVKYVVSDFMMADVWNAFYNKFGAMTVWAGDTEGYYVQVNNTGGGTGFTPSPKYFSTMEARLHIFDGRGVQLSEDIYLEPLLHYRLVHESTSTIISIGGQEVKFVKVFEYVPGAKIVGSAPDGTNALINVEIKTNQGRTFNYTQTTTSNNGTYEFIVPYSTEGPVAGGTQFDTMPVRPYTIIIGDMIGEVRVTEGQVMTGEIILLT
ncbi:MAG: oligosaccharyl transferase, archaeosortase A system-associated [Methanocellales archaeon]|nr:oligosaccharyl transferase, archaeosortase A system-associated [Methanocellales archaeon]MDD3291848.1 oligosaccharyl transferase, archaeosortase A system-associated [Methanocellales archaeon]MDD5235491.1 oligosaccharyl transferase, archaeosortase A system-associated [Methanocellales archaeon]MDD5485110.1 oligosaccharyl transferase, archaeosortase A system-associated [Methanocellales archaeon]